MILSPEGQVEDSGARQRGQTGQTGQTGRTSHCGWTGYNVIVGKDIRETDSTGGRTCKTGKMGQTTQHVKINRGDDLFISPPHSDESIQVKSSEVSMKRMVDFTEKAPLRSRRCP